MNRNSALPGWRKQTTVTLASSVAREPYRFCFFISETA
jgi:hypothetical protein